MKGIEWRFADVGSARRQPRTLGVRGHRPWPVPKGPWVMGQTWEHLLFAHWPVDEARLRAVMPPQIPVDTFEGSAWVTVTPFVVTGLRARYMPPVPGAARFPEINLRTYSTIGGRPGIYFFSLDTPNVAAVFAARRSYRLPYYRSAIEVETGDGSIAYRSRRVDSHGPSAAFSATYRAVGPVTPGGADAFATWGTERYCAYTLGDAGDVLSADIHHPPWPLQAAEASVAENTMGAQIGIDLEGEPTCHYARRQDVLFWPLRRNADDAR